MVEFFLRFLLSWTPRFRLESENGFHRVAILTALSLANLLVLPIMGYHYQETEYALSGHLNLVLASLSLIGILLLRTSIPTLWIEHFMAFSFSLIFGIKATFHAGIFSPYIFFLLLPPAYMFLVLRPKHGTIQVGFSVLLIGIADYLFRESLLPFYPLKENLQRTLIIQFFSLSCLFFVGFNQIMQISKREVEKFQTKSKQLSAKTTDQQREIKLLRIKAESLQTQIDGTFENSEFFTNEKTRELQSKHLTELKKRHDSEEFSHNLLMLLLQKSSQLFHESSHISLTHCNTKEQHIFQNLSHQSKDILTLLRNAIEITEGSANRNGQTDFDLRQLLGEILYGSHEKSQNFFLNFHLKVDYSVPRYLYGNSTLLGKAILSILSHSFATTPKGNISLHCQRLESKNSKLSLCFTIKDSSMSLSKSDAKEIFKPFVTQKIFPTLATELSGLELPLAHKWIAELGGTLEYKPELTSHGNAFNFKLSFNDSQLNQSHPGFYEYNPEETVFTDLEMVILEENKINRSLLEKAMRNWKINAHFCATIESFELLIKHHQPEMVFISSHFFSEEHALKLKDLQEISHGAEWVTMGENSDPNLKTMAKPITSEDVFKVIISNQMQKQIV